MINIAENIEENARIVWSKNGIETQFNQTTEELGELLVAINKYRRYGDIENLIEEIGDVEFMLTQIKEGLGIKEAVLESKYFKSINTVKKFENESN